MIALIQDKLEALAGLCRRYCVARLELFGSAVTGGFDPRRSDLDFLVEFHPDSPMGPFRQYFDFLAEIERLFDRRVDLVEACAIKNPYFVKAIEPTRRLLYAT